MYIVAYLRIASLICAIIAAFGCKWLCFEAYEATGGVVITVILLRVKNRDSLDLIICGANISKLPIEIPRMELEIKLLIL